MKKNQLVMGALCSAIIFWGNILLADDRNLSSTGTGNAKTTLDTGITIEEIQSADFGTITRFGEKPRGNIRIDKHGNITSDNPNIHTDHIGASMKFKISGTPGTVISYSDDGTGHMMNKDGSKQINIGWFDNDDLFGTKVLTSGEYIMNLGVLIYLTGNETDGEYSTKNPGGVPCNIVIDY